MRETRRSSIHVAAWAVVVLLLVLAAVPLASAGAKAIGTSYYVSTTGLDSNPGTISAPWRTIVHSLKSLRAGDMLFVRGGTYVERVTRAKLTSANSSAPIAVQNYQDERPVVQGLLWLNNPVYWSFDGINVTWDPATGNSGEHMVKLKGGDHWVFENAEVWGAESLANILVTNTSDGGPPSSWTLQGNCIHDNLGTEDPKDHNLYIGDIHGSSGGLVTRNVIFHAVAGQGIKLGPPDKVDGPTGVTVSYNTVFDSEQHALMVASDSHDNTVDHNLLVTTLDNGAIRGQDASESFENNVVSNNGWWDTTSLITYMPKYAPGRFVDGGGNVKVNPRFDSTESCTGFHPLNPLAQAYGAYGSSQSPSPRTGSGLSGRETGRPPALPHLPAAATRRSRRRWILFELASSGRGGQRLAA